MNQTQRDYLTRRISTICSRKIKEAAAKYTKKGGAETDKKKWALVLAHKVKPVANISNNRCSYYLEDLYDFSKYKDKVNTEKLDTTILLIQTESQKVTDLAMLGDCEMAAKLLEKFEKF